MNPIWNQFGTNFGLSWAPRVQIGVELGWVGPPESKFGLSRVGLGGFILTALIEEYHISVRAALIIIIST